MAHPLVSVVIPVYNAAASVLASLRSMYRQTLRDIEVIIVDDGSSDSSTAVIADAVVGMPQARFLKIPHWGIAVALNEGLAAARGTYVARMDADDISPEDRLERQVNALENDPSLGVVTGHVVFGGNRSQSLGFSLFVDWLNSLTTPEAISLNRFVESPVAHPSVLFRRDLVSKLGGYRDGPFPEDYEMWLRWMDAGVKFGRVQQHVLTWHDRPGRLTRTDPRYSQKAFFEVKAQYLARWLARHNPHHPDVMIWGAGRDTRKRAELLCKHGVNITSYIDIDARKIGNRIRGRRVLGETELPSPGDTFVLPYVGSRGARDDIRSRLHTRGYIEGVHFICAA